MRKQHEKNLRQVNTDSSSVMLNRPLVERVNHVDDNNNNVSFNDKIIADDIEIEIFKPTIKETSDQDLNIENNNKYQQSCFQQTALECDLKPHQRIESKPKSQKFIKYNQTFLLVYFDCKY